MGDEMFYRYQENSIDQLTATLAANLARSSALIWALVALPLCHTTRFPDHFSGVKAIDAVL
jgi:hypothetical protein